MLFENASVIALLAQNKWSNVRAFLFKKEKIIDKNLTQTLITIDKN